MYTSLLKAVIDSSNLRPARFARLLVDPALCASPVSAYTRLYARSQPLMYSCVTVYIVLYARPLSNFPTSPEILCVGFN